MPTLNPNPGPELEPEPARTGLSDDGREEDCGDGGRAENVMDVPGPVERFDGVRTCGGKRLVGDGPWLAFEFGGEVCVGVGGACAMCARPFDISMESKVVGFVLADMLLNVRGSER